MGFKNSLLNDKLKKARSSFYFRNVRKGIKQKSINAFEKNYSICWNFKKVFKGKLANEKLHELIRLSNVKIKGNRQLYAKRRIKTHPTRKKCFVCERQSYFQHHIILLINGGYDNGINRIPLCQICHEIIHPWMRIDKLNSEMDEEFRKIVELSYT